jgi:hypothetical protein
MLIDQGDLRPTDPKIHKSIRESIDLISGQNPSIDEANALSVGQERDSKIFSIDLVGNEIRWEQSILSTNCDVSWNEDPV